MEPATREDSRDSLSWLPFALALLTFLLGICCLFFMTVGGVILCILHCVLGVIFSLIPYAVYQKPTRTRGMIAVIFSTLLLLMYLITLIYACWLLAQNVRAKNDVNNDKKFPVINSLLNVYGAQTGMTVRRLQAVENYADEPLMSADEDFSRFLTAAGDAESAFNPEMSQMYPSVLRQGFINPADYKPSEGDKKCLAKLQEGEYEDALPRFESLLHRGLFCGYTRYGVTVFKKWPVNCSKDCYFDKLNFSKFENPTDADAQKQASEFVAGVKSMTKEQAQLCTLLASYTACRIEEKKFYRGVIAALSVAIPLSFLLSLLALKTIRDCMAAMGDKRQTVVVAQVPPPPSG